MKTNHVIAIAIAIVVVMLIVIVSLFSRQSTLENEIASLRITLESTPASRTVGSESASYAPSSTQDASRIGIPEPATSGDALTDARTRLLDLERVVNGQADFIEKLLAENARKIEQERRAAMRAWGPEQATGAPDTMTAGDQRSAWAPATADGGMEWLEAEFENAADLAKVVVRQTCNPGCITKVVAVTDSGAEVPIWTGVDPSLGKDLADTPFAVPGAINAKRVKVYLDTSKVAGWEEIDALQIVGRDGKSQWAQSVKSSSTYASGRATYPKGWSASDGRKEGYLKTLQNYNRL